MQEPISRDLRESIDAIIAEDGVRQRGFVSEAAVRAIRNAVLRDRVGTAETR